MHADSSNLAGSIPVFDTNDDMNRPVTDAGPTGVHTPPRAHSPDHAEFTQAHENVLEHHHHQQNHRHHHEPAAAAPATHSLSNAGVESVNANPMVSYDHSAEYAAKLAEANAEINRLQALLARHNDNDSNSIKRRTVFSDDGTSIVGDGMTDAGVDDGASVVGAAARPEGVPLNVVAMLSVLVFVVTYLFF